MHARNCRFPPLLTAINPTPPPPVATAATHKMLPFNSNRGGCYIPRTKPDEGRDTVRSLGFNKYKIQPKVRLTSSEMFRCYADVMRMFVLVVVPLQFVSYPSIKMIGIQTGLPLPSVWEILSQLGVYFMVEDYTNYWLHRFLHGKWGYDKIHRVHHEYTAPIGFASPYAHWLEILILGIPTFLGPAIAPGHMITFWLWIVLRQIESIETHSGYVCYG
ncbi:Methylsterol monooxygenase 1-1 [Hibiscus syriacus]|uniref:Methylsterol monooxygenase 1-1 n=1 Tax=Hibiscus syriacus TaxID=106335 RepID=A0A6A2YWP1_HIBSY|nr:Methylsterol monooxygenase 1-1 [Hibiscus syriacus]